MAGRKPIDSPPNAGIVGVNTRRLRIAKGATQTELAKAAGLSRSTIIAVELGKYKGMNWDTVNAIAQALGVTTDDLKNVRAERGPSAAYVDAFMASDWSKPLRPTPSEVAWLEQLPELVWFGEEPTAETVAGMLQWRRGASGR